MIKPNLIISAGGTGGHIFPALAVAKELSNQYNIIWVGAKIGLENTLVPQHGYPLETVSVGGVRNKGIVRKLSLPLTLLRSGLECLALIRKYRPVAIVGFGGYATFPICITGRICRIPVIVHEQNAVAGMTNKIVSKFANRILSAFPNVLTGSKTFLVGNPVREEIIAAYQPNKYQQPRNDKLRILIVGGSLGAKVLNDNLPLALSLCANSIGQVTHQIGRSDVEPVTKSYHDAGLDTHVNVVKFIDNMAEAFASHDLIICRAGASTVAEVAAVGIAAVFVPYPYAVDDHQTINARYLSDMGGAVLLPQTQLTPQKLAAIISTMTLDKCEEYANKARSLALLDSTQQICHHVKQVIGDR